ncbi:hypothetical protein KCU88_g311, partial [Aureobasidium melanogenum]
MPLEPSNLWMVLGTCSCTYNARVWLQFSYHPFDRSCSGFQPLTSPLTTILLGRFKRRCCIRRDQKRNWNPRSLVAKVWTNFRSHELSTWAAFRPMNPDILPNCSAVVVALRWSIIQLADSTLPYNMAAVCRFRISL